MSWENEERYQTVKEMREEFQKQLCSKKGKSNPFISEMNDLQQEIHILAKEKGWWDEETGDIKGKLLLIHAEVSEATEALRRGDNSEELEAELADVVIRVMDLSEKLGISLAKAIVKKHEKNKSRPYRHGGKKF